MLNDKTEGNNKLYTKNKANLNLNTRFADINETLSMTATLF